MDTHLPFVRPREATVRRPASTRPPAPSRPVVTGQSPLAEPPTTAPVTAPTTVVQNVTAAPATASGDAGGYVAPDAVVTAIIGGAVLAVGLVALARLGLGGSLLTPVEDLVGVPHTPLLGLVEVGVGLLFVILGVLAARSASIVVGAVVAIAGAIVVIAYDDFDADLALTRDLGWWALGIGVAVAVVNLLLPALTARTHDEA